MSVFYVQSASIVSRRDSIIDWIAAPSAMARNDKGINLIQNIIFQL